MQDMMKMYAMNGMGGMDPNMFAADQTLTLNANNELVKYIFDTKIPSMFRCSVNSFTILQCFPTSRCLLTLWQNLYSAAIRS